ncbi:response regulator [Streptomyces sp. NPDC090022]|uniref:response regulator n=1 Tax=Streptomyces sp. NPDC090022 TaxID=3365920 RepID=UPI00381E039A
MSGAVRVLLVDDHPVVRAGLRALLGGCPDFDVCGEAPDGATAVRLARELAPDLVLMDLRMGTGMCGVEATRHVVRLPAPPRVVVLTGYASDAYIVRAVEAGAAGYLLKESPPDLLLQSLRTVAAGESALSPAVASRLMNRCRAPRTALTAREIEILELIATGRSNRQIGSALFISGTTVKTHLAHVYDKLGVENRTAAVRAAVDRGLIQLDAPETALPAQLG